MTAAEAIQKTIDYMEENLKTEISTAELAELSCFSGSYFLQLFQKLTGVSCMKYISRRRLLWALYEMKQGKSKTEAALEYGYDTYSGFYRAFKRELGCTPSVYQKRYVIEKPHRLNLLQEGDFMISMQKCAQIITNWKGDFRDLKPVRFSNGILADNMWTMLGEGEKRYILSACTNEMALKRCIALSRLEESCGLATALPIMTKAGEDYVTDGDLCFYLSHKKKVVGEMRNPVDFYRQPEQAESVGRLLAKLHRTLLQSGFAEEHREILRERDLYQDVMSTFTQIRQLALLPEVFYREYEVDFGRLSAELPRQLIHRDPNYSNIILEQGKCAGFLHFELSEINFRIFDLCYAATAVLSEMYMQDDETGDWFSIYHQIVRGYDLEVSLSDVEKEALKYVVFSIQHICVGYFARYDRFDRQYEANRKMLVWLWENRERF